MELPLLLVLMLSRFCLIRTSALSKAEDVDRKVADLIADLEAQLSEVQRHQRSLQDEVNQLKQMERSTDGGIQTHENLHRRSDAAGIVPELASEDCTPGASGCPVTVRPYSVGGACMLCPAGPRGYPGPTGPPGRDGRDGRDSVVVVSSSDETGQEDPVTPPAPPGPPSNTGGAVYVRWGHTDCQASASLIYTGIAGGSRYSETGNGANQLCLPGDPVYDEPVSGVGTSRASLYGIEYQIDSYPALNDRLWHDVPCAVCKSTGRFSEMMVPGKNICPSDEWTLEYGGYLMAERSHTAHQRSMYICVDREMQIISRTHGYGDQSRGLLNLVEGRCMSSGGGLPCGPYIDAYELTCAVCTQ